MDRLRVFVDQLFSSVPPSQKAADLKQEMLQDLEDKYRDLVTGGHSEQDAYNIVVAGVGDLSSLLDELRRQPPHYAAYTSAGRQDGAPPPGGQAYAPAGPPPKRNNTGMIVGLVILGLVILLPCLGLFAFCSITNHIIDSTEGGALIDNLDRIIGNVAQDVLEDIDFSGVNGSYYQYENSGSYLVAEGAVEISGARELDINWVSGDVVVRGYDGDCIRFEEKTGGAALNRSQRLHYLLQNDQLHIQFCSAGLNQLIDNSKQLELLIPYDAMPEEIEINTVSSHITASGVSAEEAGLDTVSGYVELLDCAFRDLSMNSVSGALYLDAAGLPQSLAMETVSGDMRLALPAGSGFRAEMDSVSGDFSCEFDGVWQRDSITCNSGGAEFSFHSVSGDAEIVKR